MPRIRPLPPEPYSDGGRLAAIAVALLCCAFAGDLANILMNLHIASVTDAMVHRPSTVSSAQIHQVNQLRGVARWLPPALLVAGAAPFVAWFRRSWLNAECFAPDSMESTRGWAVGCWFVPVAAFWLPRRVAHDIRRGSSLPGGPLTARVVDLWWALWLGKALGSVVLPLVLTGVYLSSAPADADVGTVGAHADAVAGAWGSALGLLAAVAAVLFVRAVTAQQRTRAAAEGFAPSPQPAPVG